MITIIIYYKYLLFQCLLLYSIPESMKNILKSNFLREYESSCSKYPFINQYYHKLEHPNDKYLVFVYNEPGLHNGGFGDRLGGLINAMSLAIRFNRTLLIQSTNGFDKLFHPYHPNNYQISNNTYKYNYKNWTSWTNYNISLANDDRTEYDLWDCINTANSFKCGMDSGDVIQPIIKLRSNRAYLCRWSRNKQLPVYNDFIRLFTPIYSNSNSNSIDLFEVSGCLLRLAIWPSDKLWNHIIESFQSHELDLIRRYNYTSNHLLKWNYLISLHFRCGDLGYIRQSDQYDYECMHSEVISNTMNTTTNNSIVIYNIPPHRESSYLLRGTPIDLARCAIIVMNNITNYTNKMINNIWYNNMRRLEYERLKLNILIHLASDNLGSTKQMYETLQYNNTFESPNGCHIELDTTHECIALTATYWMILSISNVIITQTEPTAGSFPMSGYSRYAGIYGLKGNVFRDANNCNVIQSRYQLSYTHQGNWFCT